MQELTIRQKMLLEAITNYINENKISPTYRELSIMLNRSVSTIHDMAMKLESKGYIKTKNGCARAIILLRGI